MRREEPQSPNSVAAEIIEGAAQGMNADDSEIASILAQAATNVRNAQTLQDATQARAQAVERLFTLDFLSPERTTNIRRAASLISMTELETPSFSR